MSGIAHRTKFDDLVSELANASDIPPNEVRKLFLLLGERIMATKCLNSIELPFGIFTTQLLAPRIIRRIERTPIYTPIQYTIKFTPNANMIFDVPDIGGLSSNTFNPESMYRKCVRHKEPLKRTIEEPVPFDPFEDAIDLDESEEIQHFVELASVDPSDFQ